MPRYISRVEEEDLTSKGPSELLTLGLLTTTVASTSQKIETSTKAIDVILPTPPPIVLQKRDGNPYYITLTVSYPTTTYTTVVLLGDSHTSKLLTEWWSGGTHR
jgi:hypothetical protein